MNPPLGLCYLSSFIKSKISDIEVVGIDYALHKEYNYNERLYLQKIPWDCDFYGITGFSAQFKWIKEIVAHIKIINKNAKVIVGGPHASALPNDIYDIGADWAVRGDGEIMLYYILSGKVTYNFSLNELPWPDRELFGLENYHRTIHGENAIHVVTLRGCPYKCHFCHKSSVGTRVQYRSISNVMAEIDYLIDKYGTRAFVFYDDIFTLKRDRCLSFCEEFSRRGLIWRAWARADLVDREILEAMQTAGMQSITFGIESGSDKILTNINKRTTREKNKKALLLCKELGIPVRCSLMFGNPGEDIFTVVDTINLVAETLPDEWNLAVLAPVPGSEFWEHPEKYGLKFDKEWVKSQDYLVTNRFQDSGVGSVWIEHEDKSKEELRDLLTYMVDRLEQVCPRTNIQDTIQKIEVSKI
jgi:radical SAM superfamily enzyme YgiQ (UPF0313 family)